MKNAMVRFSATLELLGKNEGGRSTPIKSGFRTDVKFGDAYRMAVFEFEGGWLLPGDKKNVECSIMLHSETEIDSLLDQSSTHLADGSNIIGKLRIEGVLNRDEVNWKD